MYKWLRKLSLPASSLRLLLGGLLILSAVVDLSCTRRQTARRSVPGEESERTRISLQEPAETEQMEELTLPQIEQEKHPDYTFKRAENIFDINFVETDLGSALQSMCDIMSYNLLLDPAVVDTLTLSLRDVTFFKFLEVALGKKGYAYEIEDNFLYVSAPELETRIFNLNYLNIARQLQGSMNITGQGGQVSGGLIPQSNTMLQTRGIVNLWADIRNSLSEIVLGEGARETATMTSEGSFGKSDEETGHGLVIEPNSGVIQITATPDVLAKAEEFIEALEASLQRQVLIEACFAEISLTDSLKAGLEWSIIPDLTSVSNLTGAIPGGAVAGRALSPSAREFQMGVSNENINTILTAISKHGTVNVLQRPQVSTLNNQPAVIRIARNETFFQRQETPGQPATAASPATQPVVNYVPIQQPTGVVLNLVPKIGDDGLIIMSIRPSITSIAAVATSPDGLSTSPITDVREFDTVAKVRHGQTIILAGLIQERDLEETRETPVLSKLPILGRLFKQVRKNRTKVELVILLTLYINYSRTSEEITAEQLPTYREAVTRYEINQGGFIKQ